MKLVSILGSSAVIAAVVVACGGTRDHASAPNNVADAPAVAWTEGPGSPSNGVAIAPNTNHTNTVTSTANGGTDFVDVAFANAASATAGTAMPTSSGSGLR